MFDGGRYKFDKWFLVKPRGGLNDVLCQLERSWRYAWASERNLVVDTSESGLFLPISEVFDLAPHAGWVIPVEAEPGIYDHLNSLQCFPPAFSGQLKTYPSIPNSRMDWDRWKKDHPGWESPAFHFGRNPSQQVVLHEGQGGGILSKCFLSRLSLSDKMSIALFPMLEKLTEDYISVHVRHSDLKTNYGPLLEEVKREVGFGPVFLATDSREVIDRAKEFFDRNQLITSDLPEKEDGSALHTDQSLPKKERESRIVSAFFDLFALSSGTKFFFASTDSKNGVSGYTRLAKSLSLSPGLRSKLLSNANNTDSVRHLFRKCQPVFVATPGQRIWEAIRWLRHYECISR